MESFLIGVCGGSGSGKTSFIDALFGTFGADKICVISQDDYYLPDEQQIVDKEGLINFDLPESIDRQQFSHDLAKLIDGVEVQKKECAFNNDPDLAKFKTFKPAPVIIVEGIFIFHFEEIRKLLQLKIFLEAKDNLKVIRRIKRDKIERNYDLDEVLYRYENHVLPAYEQYIEPYRGTVDLIINNNDNFEVGLQVMKGFLRDLLSV